jgi:hypothetical protein
MYQDENKPLEALIDRLHAEQHLEMMRQMVAHPQEGTAWEEVYKKCVARQGVGGGGLTLDVTEKFATEAMNLLAQPMRGGSQNHVNRRPQANQQTRRCCGVTSSVWWRKSSRGRPHMEHWTSRGRPLHAADNSNALKRDGSGHAPRSLLSPGGAPENQEQPKGVRTRKSTGVS